MIELTILGIAVLAFVIGRQWERMRHEATVKRLWERLMDLTVEETL